MKLAISARSSDLGDEVDPRFGRAAYILLVDADSKSFEVIDNSANVNAFKGAGIQAAATVCDKGADVVLTGYCGPKAYQVLNQASVKVVNDVTGTVEEVVDTFNAGKYTYATESNAEAHW